jgi:hypothetical protein
VTTCTSTLVPSSPPLDEAGLAILMDPARNAEGVLRGETFEFLRCYLPKAVNDYDYRVVQAVAEEYFCTEEITVFRANPVGTGNRKHSGPR